MGVIQFLPPEEARKIAAGEVIDRPAALAREFLDNALDADADAVELVIQGGGASLVEVNDNGGGIARDDLEIACKTHATSKIRSLGDLETARTLGFRGEALAAAAAVSRLEIISSVDGETAWRLSTGGGEEELRIEPARRVRGTTVRAHRLFESIPARKRFLKRDASEALLCRQIFTEKALAFPRRSFRFTQDGKPRAFFPAVSSYRERTAQALLPNQGEAAFLHEITAGGGGFVVTIVVGGPEIYRAHRREQFIFANGRRIAEFSFQQALEYGVQGAFPNGCHPLGALFIDIDPGLADFNVHPAKREAKFADSGAIHHAISTALRVFFHNLLVAKARGLEVGGRCGGHSPQQSLHLLAEPAGGTPAMPAFLPPAGGAADTQAEVEPGGGTPAGLTAAPCGSEGGSPPLDRNSDRSPEKSAAPFRYVGSAFNLFLLVEYDGRLFAVDQHAAHERLLYNRTLEKPVLKQELLVPIPFATEDESDDRFLEAHRGELDRLGLGLAGEAGAWRIEALPALWRAGDGETVQAVLGLKTAGENIAERWAATLACHSALRDGDMLDGESARRFLEEALALPVQCCPHGRPFVAEIKKDDLLRAVRRL